MRIGSDKRGVVGMTPIAGKPLQAFAMSRISIVVSRKRKPMRRVLMSPWALLLTLAALPAFAQQKDVITLRNRDTREGKVVRVTYKEVAYSPGAAAEMRESAADVEGIAFYDAPYTLGAGERELQKGSLEGALTQFRRALEEIERGNARAIHKQYVLSAIARAYLQAGNLKEAVKAYRKLLAEVPDTFFATQAYENALGCAEQTQDWASLDDLVDLMRKAPGDLRDILRSTANEADARRLFREKKYADARNLFDQLSRDSDERTQAKGKAGILHCLSAEKRTEDLRRYADAIVRGKDTEAVSLGAAWTALGDLAFAQSQGKDPAALKEALLSYLRTREMYAPPGGDRYDYARALLYAGKCFDLLRAGKSNQDDKNEYRRRAMELYEDLRRNYRDTDAGALVDGFIRDLER